MQTLLTVWTFVCFRKVQEKHKNLNKKIVQFFLFISEKQLDRGKKVDRNNIACFSGTGLLLFTYSRKKYSWSAQILLHFSLPSEQIIVQIVRCMRSNTTVNIFATHQPIYTVMISSFFFIVISSGSRRVAISACMSNAALFLSVLQY